MQQQNAFTKSKIQTLEKDVKNKDRTTPLALCWCCYRYLWACFTLFSSVFFDDFEHKNVCWVSVFKKIPSKCNLTLLTTFTIVTAITFHPRSNIPVIHFCNILLNLSPNCNFDILWLYLLTWNTFSRYLKFSYQPNALHLYFSKDSWYRKK